MSYMQSTLALRGKKSLREQSRLVAGTFEEPHASAVSIATKILVSHVFLDLLMLILYSLDSEACWRDDLESLGYMLLYLARGGRLPWWPLAEDLIEKEKSRTSVKELCRGLPPDFTLYFKYVRGLKFGERPDYGRLRRLFRCLFKAQGYKYDNIFDWTEKMFREMQEDEDSQLTRSQMTR